MSFELNLLLYLKIFIRNQQNMKTFTFVLCVAISCVLAAPPNLKQIHEDCQLQHHIDDDVFKAIHRDEPYDKTLVGAHMVCMSTKLGYLNEDGTVNRDGLKTALAHEIKDEAKLEEVVNKCAVNESTPGETAIKLSNCVRENLPRGRHGHGHQHGHGHGPHHGYGHGPHQGYGHGPYHGHRYEHHHESFEESGEVLAAPPNIKQIHDDCQLQHHIDDDVFKAIHRGEPYDRTLVGAHMVCMSTKLGSLNEDGTVNRDGLKTALAHQIKDEAKLEEVVNKCTVNESTPGETAIKLSNCVRENIPEGRHGHGHYHGHGHGPHHGHRHGHHHESSEESREI